MVVSGERKWSADTAEILYRLSHVMLEFALVCKDSLTEEGRRDLEMALDLADYWVNFCRSEACCGLGESVHGFLHSVGGGESGFDRGERGARREPAAESVESHSRDDSVSGDRGEHVADSA